VGLRADLDAVEMRTIISSGIELRLTDSKYESAYSDRIYSAFPLNLNSSRRSIDLTTHVHLTLRFRMLGNLPQLPNTSLWNVVRKIHNFSFYLAAAT
jgi:hypothetical protein